MYKNLEGINSPKDIKSLNNKELEELAKDIRKFLVKKVSATGGHLASNLGVVELTLALHKVFDTPKDKFIWDVGHQAYVHKILTGRRDEFSSLRQFNGLAGFPKESESEHDAFDTGHSSTSISAGLGMAAARDIQKKDFQVVSIIGDGAITGGMAVEALNNLGFLKKNMIVIFNDNEMSIDKNTGAFSTYMSKMILNSDAYKAKDSIDRIMNLTQVGGKLSRKASKLADSIVSVIAPEECSFIDALGIKYLGPIDGHNLQELIAILKYAKSIDGPKFIHVKTIKGKGYRFAETKPENYHGVGKFDFKKGVEPSSKRSISSIVGHTLSEMADENEDIVAITAAMPTGTGLNIYEKAHPDRYFDVGIAEQHAVTFSAGIAKEGLKPYFAVYSTFLQRGYDQVIHDVCITKKPVTFLIDRAGLVGNDGETHQGQFDLSFLNPIPEIMVMAPSDTEEMVKMIQLSEKIDQPLAIRYPRGSEYYLEVTPKENLDISLDTIGRPRVILDNIEEGKTKIVIATIGKMLITAVKAVQEILEERDDLSFRVLDARYLKPMDEECYLKHLRGADKIFTLEDNVRTGGFGYNIEQIVVNNKLGIDLEVIGLPDEFVPQGDTEILMDSVGMSVEKIKNKIKGQ